MSAPKKYVVWNVDGNTASCGQNGNEVIVKLTETTGPVQFEGWWPHAPESVRNIICGICLWDAGWMIHFAPGNKKSPGAKSRSLALPRDRAKAYDSLQKGRVVRGFSIPQDPGPYHTKLAEWIGLKAQALGAENVFCHVPRLEYHAHVGILEAAIGHALPKMHGLVDEFAEKVTDLVKKQVTTSDLTFIEPMAMGITRAAESYTLPYRDPARLGIPAAGLVGVEDLIELKIFLMARQAAKAVPKTVLTGILDFPHPYTVNARKKIEIAVVGGTETIVSENLGK